MTEQVIVSLKGLQRMGEENGETIELVSQGTYRYEDGNHRIQYEEIDEEEQKVTNVTVIANESHVEIVKRGLNNVEMVFHENKKTISCYQTPYGDLTLGIDTSGIRVTEYGDRMEIVLDYGLHMNSSHVADCSMEMKISCCNVLPGKTGREL